MNGNVIIKSKIKGQQNWSGKEFSSNPAKIYSCFEDATHALQSYWFNDYAKEHNNTDQREVIIIHLTEKQKDKLLAAGTIRW